MEKAFFLRLTKGINNIPVAVSGQLLRNYSLDPTFDKQIEIPVEKHIRLYMILNVSQDLSVVTVKDRFFKSTVGDLEAAYSELELARQAVPALETKYYDALFGGHA